MAFGTSLGGLFPADDTLGRSDEVLDDVKVVSVHPSLRLLTQIRLSDGKMLFQLLRRHSLPIT